MERNVNDAFWITEMTDVTQLLSDQIPFLTLIKNFKKAAIPVQYK